jgi:universal stress protein E
MSQRKFRKVLVAVKPWQRSMPLAAEHARFLAQDLEAEVRLVTCIFDAQVAFGLSHDEPSAMSAQAGLIQNCQRELDKSVKKLRDSGISVSAEVLWDEPIYEGLLREVRDWGADLLVVGVHRSRPVGHARLGDMDWQLLRHAPCPLLIVKDSSFDGYRAIVAAVDPLQGHAEPAGLDREVLAAAREIGRASHAEVYAANAYPDPANYAWASSVEVLPGIFYGPEHMESLHRRAVAELVGEYGIAPSRIDLRPGQPAPVIADVVAERKAQLVVLGAVRHGRLQQVLLGSTAEAVVETVDCDILLVKLPGAESDAIR